MSHLRSGLAALRSGPHTISPTAHYTGYVWVRHGYAPAELATPAGRVFFHSIRPLMAVGRAIGPGSLEEILLARHALIDERLGRAIASGRVTQVVEIAAGLSPRGLRCVEAYGDRVTYVEADLPAMAARKRDALDRLGVLGPRHRVVDIDALEDDGPLSLASITRDLDRSQGLAIITEGLLNYLSPADVAGLWSRIAHVLEGFVHGVYLSDLHLAAENDGRIERIGMALVAPFVRGRMYLHFNGVAGAIEALELAGFDHSELHRPSEFPGVRVIESRTEGGR